MTRSTTYREGPTEPDTEGLTAPIHLPCLRVLSIHSEFAYQAENLASLLVTPALNDMSYRSSTSGYMNGSGPDESARNVRSILDSSNLVGPNRLRRLSLDPGRWAAGELYSLLEMLPGLSELCLQTSYISDAFGVTPGSWGPATFIDDEFLSRLAGNLGDATQNMGPHVQSVAGRGTVLLPCLSTLTLFACMSFTKNVFQHFLCSRCQRTREGSISRLTSFHFGDTKDGYCRLTVEEMLDVLEPFEDDGLEVMVREYHESVSEVSEGSWEDCE